MPKATRWTAEDLPDLSGKGIIVTGGNSGLGYQAALQFARKGARVLLACRSRSRARAASEAIAAAHPQAAPEVMELDLASLSSIRDFAKAFLEQVCVIRSFKGQVSKRRNRFIGNNFEVVIHRGLRFL